MNKLKMNAVSVLSTLIAELLQPSTAAFWTQLPLASNCKILLASLLHQLRKPFTKKKKKKKKLPVYCFRLSVMTSPAFHPLAKGFRLLDFSHLDVAVEGSNSSSSGPSVDMRMRSESLEVLRLLLTSDFILFWALKALSQFADEMGKTRRVCTRRRIFSGPSCKGLLSAEYCTAQHIICLWKCHMQVSWVSSTPLVADQAGSQLVWVCPCTSQSELSVPCGHRAVPADACHHQATYLGWKWKMQTLQLESHYPCLLPAGCQIWGAGPVHRLHRHLSCVVSILPSSCLCFLSVQGSEMMLSEHQVSAFPDTHWWTFQAFHLAWVLFSCSQDLWGSCLLLKTAHGRNSSGFWSVRLSAPTSWKTSDRKWQKATNSRSFIVFDTFFPLPLTFALRLVSPRFSMWMATAENPPALFTRSFSPFKKTFNALSRWGTQQVPFTGFSL